MELDYNKTFKIEIINEYAHNVYNRIMNYIFNHDIDEENTRIPIVNISQQMRETLRIELFNLSMNELNEMQGYWQHMDDYTNQLVQGAYTHA